MAYLRNSFRSAVTDIGSALTDIGPAVTDTGSATTGTGLTDLIRANMSDNPVSKKLKPSLLAINGAHCETEATLVPMALSLRVGKNGSIKRWAKGVVLKYNMDSGSFNCMKDYSIVKEALDEVAGTWNGLNLGVTFKAVDDDEPAIFQVVYRQYASGDNDTYAFSFFPGDLPRRRKLFVFAKSFEPDIVDSMANILCHEVGHILGLRHEFADKDEKGDWSVQFGPENPQSFMNYFEHPCMMNLQQLDIIWLWKFYAYNKQDFCGVPIIDVNP
ncbi:hypothetical protein F5B20DRAFT_534436 [Whalleya microplaca]|nr:hypothetical protein F5B20DRAFT_534436 [Whalleya microplaca]